MQIQWMNIWTLFAFMLLSPIFAGFSLFDDKVRKEFIVINYILSPTLRWFYTVYKLITSRQERETRRKIIQTFSLNGWFLNHITVKGNISGKEYKVGTTDVYVKGIGRLCVHPTISNECSPMESLFTLALHTAQDETRLVSTGNYAPFFIGRKKKYEKLCRELKVCPHYFPDYTH